MSLTAEQRRRLEAIMRIQSEAKDLQLVLTVRCKSCGAPLSAAKSMSRVQGPVCRAKK
jgi:hypothetical protein